MSDCSETDAWDLLVSSLTRLWGEHNISQKAGRLEILTSDPDENVEHVTFLISREQWAKVLATEFPRRSVENIDGYLAELMERDLHAPDPQFIVFYENRLWLSGREDLPPLAPRDPSSGSTARA